MNSEDLCLAKNLQFFGHSDNYILFYWKEEVLLIILATKSKRFHWELAILWPILENRVGLNWLPMAVLGLLKMNNGHKMVNS